MPVSENEARALLARHTAGWHRFTELLVVLEENMSGESIPLRTQLATGNRATLHKWQTVLLINVSCSWLNVDIF